MENHDSSTEIYTTVASADSSGVPFHWLVFALIALSLIAIAKNFV